MKFTKSIHWRLLIWIAILLGLVLLALDFTAYEIHFNNHISQLDYELQRRVTILNAAFFAPTPGRPEFGNDPPDEPDDFGPPPEPPEDFGGPPPDFPRDRNDHHGPSPDGPGPNASQLTAAARRFAPEQTAGFYFSIWKREATVPYRQSTNCPLTVARPAPAGKDTGTYTRTRDGFREAYHATEFGDCILVGRALAPVLAETRQFGGWLGLGSFVVLAFGLGGAWFIVAGALRPVGKISAAAAKISSGDLSQRISVAETESELGQLAAILNSAFARLEAAFAQQKQFTTDAAHELRTPLAILISEAQTTLARERGASDYKESLVANLDTAQQMRRLADSLLELSRFDAGQENLRRKKTDLSVIVEDCVKFVIPLAAPRQVQILCDLAPAEVFADAERLAQVVKNLLTNAINYNRNGGEIRVALRAEKHAAILTVADTGGGIAAADLPRVFERFFRAEKSRAAGGCGLGLAICKAVVTSHGGTIEAESELGKGATFTVRLPLA